MAIDPIYNRILLKLSGEALMGNLGFGLDLKTVQNIALDIKSVKESGTQVCIVIGGGNIFRGIAGVANGLERSSADHMGMLATIINSLALQSVLEYESIATRVLSAIPMATVCEPYIRRRAIRHMEKGRVVIFAAGTGNPFFSTDTAATLRASELDCNFIIKATKVNGIYDMDPVKNTRAKLIKKISYSEVINKNLKVMDLTAISLAKDTKIPIYITNIFSKNSLINVLNQKGSYSKIS